MHSFSDKNGKAWTIELTIGVIEEIKGRLEIDLLDPDSSTERDIPLIAKLSPIGVENIKLFCNMLYLLCEEQCKECGIDSAQFGRLLSPKALKDAYDAFFKEWLDFFQSLDRMEMVEMMKKAKELAKEAAEELVKEIKRISVKEVLEQGKKEFPHGNLSVASAE